VKCAKYITSQPLFQLDLPIIYGPILSRLNVRTIYSKRRHLGASFLLKFFNDKINCRFTLNKHGLILPIKQITNLSVFAVRIFQGSTLQRAPPPLWTEFADFYIIFSTLSLEHICIFFILFSLLCIIKFLLWFILLFKIIIIITIGTFAIDMRYNKKCFKLNLFQLK
jgi:hypothetical protein